MILAGTFDNPVRQKKEYQAAFDSYNHMAYYLADRLNIRPSEILDGWGVPELMVTYGQFINTESYKHFREYQAMDPESRAKVKTKPKEYVVKFQGMEDFED